MLSLMDCPECDGRGHEIDPRYRFDYYQPGDFKPGPVCWKCDGEGEIEVEDGEPDPRDTPDAPLDPTKS